MFTCESNSFDVRRPCQASFRYFTWRIWLCQSAYLRVISGRSHALIQSRGVHGSLFSWYAVDSGCVAVPIQTITSSRSLYHEQASTTATLCLPIPLTPPPAISIISTVFRYTHPPSCPTPSHRSPPASSNQPGPITSRATKPSSSSATSSSSSATPFQPPSWPTTSPNSSRGRTRSHGVDRGASTCS